MADAGRMVEMRQLWTSIHLYPGNYGTWFNMANGVMPRTAVITNQPQYMIVTDIVGVLSSVFLLHWVLAWGVAWFSSPVSAHARGNRPLSFHWTIINIEFAKNNPHFSESRCWRLLRVRNKHGPAAVSTVRDSYLVITLA
jgi:hypothetical protein